MKKRRRVKRWIIAGAVVLFLGLAGLLGTAGCAQDDEATLTTGMGRADKEMAAWLKGLGSLRTLVADSLYRELSI